MSVSADVPNGWTCDAPTATAHVCNHIVQDGGAAWWLIHRTPYTKNITLGRYLALVSAIVTEFPCPKCGTHEVAFQGTRNYDMNDILCTTDGLLDDVCFWAFTFHNEVSKSKNATIARVSDESMEWACMDDRAEVLVALHAKYGYTASECSA